MLESERGRPAVGGVGAESDTTMCAFVFLFFFVFLWIYLLFLKLFETYLNKRIKDIHFLKVCDFNELKKKKQANAGVSTNGAPNSLIRSQHRMSLPKKESLLDLGK